jgi:hypothetical protein
MNEYGGLFEQAHEQLAESLDAAGRVYAMGQRRDGDGMGVVRELRLEAESGR